MISMTNKNVNGNAVLKNLHTLFYFINIAVIIISTIPEVNSSTDLSKNEFDHLIFTQRWLPSACLAINKNCEGSNCCELPDDWQVWSIHGLWPQYKNSFGPFFCNKSIKFNETLIDPIKPTLLRLWPNIEEKKSTESLWKHEWLKHGSCAAALEKLNNEFKYFNTSLNIFEVVNMNEFFEKIRVKPNNEGVDIKYLLKHLGSALGKYPFLHCSKEIEEDEAYLVEVRLCYNLNLELIDCGTPDDNELKAPLLNSLTNCPLDSLTRFPFSPSLPNNSYKNRYKRYLHYRHLNELLKIVKFLLWVSL